MRRHRKKRIKIVPILTLLIIIVGSFYGIHILKKSRGSSEPLDAYINNEVKEKEYSTSLIMVGDVLIHDRLYNDAKSGNTYNFKKYLPYIKEYVKKFDLAYYNQETILGGSSIGLSSYPSFNSPQEVGDAMIDAGFNMVSLATNHTLDRGVKATKLSRDYWNKQNGVQAVGSYNSFNEKEEIESRVLESNGITYAFLNYTYGTNGIPVPYGKEYVVNLWENNNDSYKKQVESDINKLRDKVDVLIVAMHWGIEYTHTPTDIEKRTAKYLSSLGVDIIIGTHPHVIQPVEYVGDTLVFYSLGNFISAQTSDSCVNYKCFVGLMSSLKITKNVNEDDIKINISNIKNELIFTYHDNYKNYMVIPFSNKDISKYLKDYKTIYKKYAKIVDSSDERIELVSMYEE